MTKSKKVKGLKKVSKFGIGKFLVMALVLGGGLIYGTQMVQKNQENRSSATSRSTTYTAKEYSGGTKTACSSIGGKCGNFSVVLKNGSNCKVGSVIGIIYSGKCAGSSTVKCCAPSSITTNNIIQDAKCTSVGGICQKTETTCKGTFKVDLCPSSGPSVKCCVSDSVPTPTPTTSATKYCGIANGTKSSSMPYVTHLCVSGFTRDVTDSNAKDGTYNWKCTDGRIVSVCSANKITTSVKKTTTGRVYWYYNGSKCVETGDNYASLTLCTNNVRRTCYSTEANCNVENNL